MMTPTALDPNVQHDAPARGDCPCTPNGLCPSCMGKLQRMRHEWALSEWLRQWESVPRPAPKGRPALRLVQGGR